MSRINAVGRRAGPGTLPAGRWTLVFLAAAVAGGWSGSASASWAAAGLRGDQGEVVDRPAARRLTLDDLFALKTVADPQVSPEGEWVAYTVTRLDAGRDEEITDIWMTSWDGARSIQLTRSQKSERKPRFSPDGRYLAFLSAREHAKEKSQLWLMERAGGEAGRVTDLPGGVSDYAWSPDGSRIVLVAADPDPDEAGEKPGAEAAAGKEGEKKPKPRVIDRFQFKDDDRGYLRTERRHLYLLDPASHKLEQMTTGPYEELLPAFSPDGGLVAFVTKRGEDPDRHGNWDIYVMPAQPGTEAARVTTNDGPDSDPELSSRPSWRHDGKALAYVHGGPQELLWYAVLQAGIVNVADGATALPTADLDRNVRGVRWAPGGESLRFIVEDDGGRFLAEVPAAGGTVRRLTSDEWVIRGYSMGADGRTAVLASNPHSPLEVYALGGDRLRPLSRQNDQLMAGLRLGETRRIRFPSADGTGIHGFVVLPPDYEDGRRYPAILDIHGGPVSQFEHRFDFDWQLYAAHGYVVVAANPRGSSGRGEAFQKAIWADWGGVDVEDVLAAVDHVTASGWADPERLGLGGWSYGGMLTNYTIARDTRFKAAVSGASISNVLSGYGTDHYIREYEWELGRPWEDLEDWMRVSYPFFHADRIKTPTLFLCGEKDVNVPLLASEQMYQALRSLGVPTGLVIYPGEHHGIDRPSFQRDRLERFLGWFDRYQKEAPAAGVKASR